MASADKKNESQEKKDGALENKLTSRVLIAPWITEAATAALENNKYIFKVDSKADKKQIKTAIENLYKVKVNSVNTVSVGRKFKNYGRTPGWKTGFKKAIVTLKDGDKIELYEGV